jgi:hypothetical protein
MDEPGMDEERRPSTPP